MARCFCDKFIVFIDAPLIDGKLNACYLRFNHCNIGGAYLEEDSVHLILLTTCNSPVQWLVRLPFYGEMPFLLRSYR